MFLSRLFIAAQILLTSLTSAILATKLQPSPINISISPRSDPSPPPEPWPATDACSFHLLLIQRCISTTNDNTNPHVQVTAKIPNIDGMLAKPLITYTPGDSEGRVDAPQSKNFTIPGEIPVLSMQFGADNVTYFGYGTDRWNTSTVEMNMVEKGFCRWDRTWSNENMLCGDGHKDYSRSTEMDCVFLCVTA